MRQTYRSLRRPRYRFTGGLRHWLAHRVFLRKLWRPDRRAVSVAVGIGLAVAMLPPIPVQMVLAVLIAVLCHANIPVAAAMVWVSNPATWFHILMFQRELGRKLLPSSNGLYDVGLDISLETVRSVTFGVVVTGSVLGLLGFFIVYLVWGLFERPRPKPEAAVPRLPAP